MDNNLIKFSSLIDQLLEVGEDEEEMIFWKNIFSSLSAGEQTVLLEKLETELQTLKNLQ